MFELEDKVFKHINTSNNLEEKMDTMDEKMKNFSRDMDILEPKNTLMADASMFRPVMADASMFRPDTFIPTETTSPDHTPFIWNHLINPSHKPRGPSGPLCLAY